MRRDHRQREFAGLNFPPVQHSTDAVAGDAGEGNHPNTASFGSVGHSLASSRRMLLLSTSSATFCFSRLISLSYRAPLVPRPGSQGILGPQ